jgi:antitoxin component YwqK of YwqJK toxin-antitoxin module
MNRNIIFSIAFILFAQLLFSQVNKININNSQYISQSIYIDENGSEVTSFDINENISDGVYQVYIDESFETLYLKGTIFNGERNGKWYFYSLEGDLLRICQYDNGVKEGKESLFSLNGLIIEERFYSQDQLNGQRKFYNSDGFLRDVQVYKNGIYQKQ